jgi:RimJ/RimL family protein N-acetyltransferase
MALPTLTDGRVLLRAAGQRDLPAIEAGIHDPDVIRWIGPQLASAAEVLARDEAWWAAQGWPTLVICQPDGTCLGKVWLEIRDTDRSTGYVGYWLLPAGRGRGLATSAVRLLSAWALRELGITRIRLTTAPGNERSHRVAERSGFRRIMPREGEAFDPAHAEDFVYELEGVR